MLAEGAKSKSLFIVGNLNVNENMYKINLMFYLKLSKFKFFCF